MQACCRCGQGGANGSQDFIRMVTLAGFEPATPLAPARNKGALSPLSYSAVMILTTVCGGARAGIVYS